MKTDLKEVSLEELSHSVKNWISGGSSRRLGMLTSVDGRQLVTLVLDPNAGNAECWLSPMAAESFKTLTTLVPQTHWFERAIYDLFGLMPEQHPRLKHILLHDEYQSTFHPLHWRELARQKEQLKVAEASSPEQRQSHMETGGDGRTHARPYAPTPTGSSLHSHAYQALSLQTDGEGPADLASKDTDNAISEMVSSATGSRREYKFLEVKGKGVYELPVGPIHASVIEPGHFRFSCFGETILNLEIRLGYVHRGVEKRLTEVPWQKARFVAEAAASDTAAANAIAHAVAIESLFDLQVPPLAQSLRTIALEAERLAMHINDVGGMGTDTGFLSISANAGRLRGMALSLAHMLSGSRFFRSFILPGGVSKVREKNFPIVLSAVRQLRKELRPFLEILQENQVVRERMEKIGSISTSLAHEFGLVGVAARACGIAYDCRQHFPHGNYPWQAPPITVQNGGDILARTQVRIGEIGTSLDTIERALENLPTGSATIDLQEQLPANQIGLAIVEAHRGELIHLMFTDEQGAIKRYAIKDPSFNNWTAVSIAIRNNLIADFPLCNKSFAFSYSGNDL